MVAATDMHLLMFHVSGRAELCTCNPLPVAAAHALSSDDAACLHHSAALGQDTEIGKPLQQCLTYGSDMALLTFTAGPL